MVTVTTSATGASRMPDIPEVKYETTSSKSASSYMPLVQVGSTGLAQARGASTTVRVTRSPATQTMRFMDVLFGTAIAIDCQILRGARPGRAHRHRVIPPSGAVL